METHAAGACKHSSKLERCPNRQAVRAGTTGELLPGLRRRGGGGDGGWLQLLLLLTGTALAALAFCPQQAVYRGYSPYTLVRPYSPILPFSHSLSLSDPSVSSQLWHSVALSLSFLHPLILCSFFAFGFLL